MYYINSKKLEEHSTNIEVKSGHLNEGVSRELVFYECNVLWRIIIEPLFLITSL